jgi:hypothetical protein
VKKDHFSRSWDKLDGEQTLYNFARVAVVSNCKLGLSELVTV